MSSGGPPAPLEPSPRVDRYGNVFPDRWSDSTPLGEVRFVVFDAETTSTDPRSARLVTLGAVTLRGGEILLENSFEAMLKLGYNSAAVTVHGITREQSLEGLDEDEALEQFLEYVGDAVIVGHHVAFDVAVLNAALERQVGIELRNRTLDTMELALLLADDGVLTRPDDYSLDALLRLFELSPHDRHTAAGDAFLTAIVLLRLLRRAEAAGRTTLGALAPSDAPSAPVAPPQ